MQFVQKAGRDHMIDEIDVCQVLFELANRQLSVVVQPIREAHGLTDEMLQEAWRIMLDDVQAGG